MSGYAMAGASLAGSALQGFMQMQGAREANAMSQSLAQQQMMQQQGFVDASRMDQYAFLNRNEGMQREMADLGIQHAFDMAERNQSYSVDMFNRNAALQTEFAQNGLRWKMEDATRAGIHPVFAMGAPGQAAAPIQISGSGSPYSPQSSPSQYSPSGGSPVGVPSFQNPMAGFQGLGQDLARAVHATQTSAERQSDQINFMEIQRHQWAKESHDMQMALGASRLALINQPGSGKGGMPDSVGSTGVTKVEPYELTKGAQPSSNSIGPAQPGAEWRTVGGGITAMPAKGLNMDDFSSPGYSSWMIPNKLEPFFTKNPSSKPPEVVWKQLWPKADDVEYVLGTWYPKYGAYADPYTGLRNSRGGIEGYREKRNRFLEGK